MRCPVCKADNIESPQCRRCKADLSPLFALAEQRGQALAEARRCLRRGEWQEALQRAEAADWLCGDEESQRLTAVFHLLQRDFTGAWRAYQRWRAMRASTTDAARRPGIPSR